MVSCLPKSNKGMNDDYLIVFGEWHDGLYYPTQKGELGGGTLGLGPLVGDLTLLALLPFTFNTSPSSDDNFH